MSIIKRVKPGPRMSGAVVHGNTVYLAGLTADDKNQDVKGQTRQILAEVSRRCLRAAEHPGRIHAESAAGRTVPGRVHRATMSLWCAEAQPANTRTRSHPCGSGPWSGPDQSRDYFSFFSAAQSR